jgi:hypothetical protein
VINGSAVTVTAAAGMILGSMVIRDVYARYNPERQLATKFPAQQAEEADLSLPEVLRG